MRPSKKSKRILAAIGLLNPTLTELSYFIACYNGRAGVRAAHLLGALDQVAPQKKWISIPRHELNQAAWLKGQLEGLYALKYEAQKRRERRR